MELETDRLVLRTVTLADIKEVARMWSFEKGEISLAEAKRAIEWMEENHEKNKKGQIVHVCFAIFEKNRDEIIGWCRLDGRHDHLVSIFYLIDGQYRRRGYATECAGQLLDFGFSVMGVDRIDGKCSSENLGSQKVLEKLGMKNLGVDQDGSLHYCIDLDNYNAARRYLI